MTRYLYHWLLRLHPPRFRDRYAQEMQWIFDETAETRGRCALLGDALLSLIRQWASGPQIARETGATTTAAHAAAVPEFYISGNSTLSAGSLLKRTTLSVASFVAAAFVIAHGGPSGLVRLPRVVMASSNTARSATSGGISPAIQQLPELRNSSPRAGTPRASGIPAQPAGKKGGSDAVPRHFEEGGGRFSYERKDSAPRTSLIVLGLIQEGRLEEAASILLRDPKTYPPPWYQLDALARAYAKRGDTDRVIRYYTLSLRENANNEWAKRRLTGLGVDVDAILSNPPR